MVYPPAVNERAIEILWIIAKGHPERTMMAHQRGQSKQVPAITWDETQIASGLKIADLRDLIANLVANKYIASGNQLPSFWGRIKGQEPLTYFWATDAGLARLAQPSSSEGQNGIKHGVEDLRDVGQHLNSLGFLPTQYGASVALLSLESGYSAAEVASLMALATMARAAKDAENNFFRSLSLLDHARAMIDVLASFRDEKLMRDEWFRNDSSALLNSVIIDKDQKYWIERVLSDGIISKEPVATSTIKYDR